MNEKQKWVAPIEDSPKPPPSRVTLTYPIINNSATGIFVVVGSGKADIIKVYFLNIIPQIKACNNI